MVTDSAIANAPVRATVASESKSFFISVVIWLLLFSIYLRRGLELWLVSVSCRKITINLWLEQLSSVKFRLNKETAD